MSSFLGGHLVSRCQASDLNFFVATDLAYEFGAALFLIFSQGHPATPGPGLDLVDVDGRLLSLTQIVASYFVGSLRVEGPQR